MPSTFDKKHARAIMARHEGVKYTEALRFVTRLKAMRERDESRRAFGTKPVIECDPKGPAWQNEELRRFCAAEELTPSEPDAPSPPEELNPMGFSISSAIMDSATSRESLAELKRSVDEQLHTALDEEHRPPGDERRRLAQEFVEDGWADRVAEVGLRRALDEVPETYFSATVGEEDAEYFAPMLSAPLRDSLGLTDDLIDAMAAAYENIRRMIETMHGPSGEHARYHDQWAKAPATLLETRGVFDGLASCQGGNEPSVIYMHPLVGVNERISPDEYRIRTAPYVAAFGAETFPGDLAAGLVQDEVRSHLSAGR